MANRCLSNLDLVERKIFLAIVVLIGRILVWLLILVVLAQVSYREVHQFKTANRLCQGKFTSDNKQNAIARLAADRWILEDALAASLKVSTMGLERNNFLAIQGQIVGQSGRKLFLQTSRAGKRSSHQIQRGEDRPLRYKVRKMEHYRCPIVSPPLKTKQGN